MRLNKTSVHSAIKLTDTNSVPKDVQVLRTGKFNHPQYGTFEITAQILAEMKMNFDNKVRGIDTAFDYYHDSNEDASGWVNSLNLSADGTELWADVTWTPKAQQKLMDRELRYFSPDFSFQWDDPESGESYNNVLFGGGLTNRPFVKEMAAIVADENTKRGYNMNLEQAQAALKLSEQKVIKLTEQVQDAEKKLAAAPTPEEVAAMDDLKKQIADLQAKLKQMETDAGVMAAEKKTAEEAKALAEKESAFTVLLSEGKACVAQKPAFLKGDMTEFIKLAQPLNMRAHGSSHNQDATVDEKTAAILKLAEELKSKNSKLSQGDAISMAKKQLK